MRRSAVRTTLVCVVLVLLGPWFSASAGAKEKADKQEPPKVQKLVVYPPQIHLAGARAAQSLRVVAQLADGTQRLVTEQCAYQSNDPKVAVVEGPGRIVPQANGRTQIVVQYHGATVQVPLVVSRREDAHYNFRNDVLPVISKLGCNQMGCHGSPKGKKRLHLSLFSADPHKDYLEITDPKKKLIDPKNAEESWLLQKALCYEDHGGGDVLEEDSPAHRLLVEWIAQGAPEGKPGDPVLERIEVFPPRWELLPGKRYPLIVEAYYSDGTMEEVTHLASYKSNEEAVAKVDAAGRVTGTGYGEAVVLVGYNGALATARVRSAQPVKVQFPQVPVNNRIDELVLAKLRELNIVPSKLCSDEEFLRRVYLDVIGVLPTPEEARRFLADPSPNKRAALIDELLDRPEYADFYAVKWGDILQINRGIPARLQDKGMWAYYRWLWHALDSNMPMDRFVHELLTATGSGYRNGPANFFRVGQGPQGMAEQASTVFLGVRLDCAHCHNHPFEQFTLADNLGMAAFFARVRIKRTQEQDEEVIYLADSGRVVNPETKKPLRPKFLGGRELKPEEIQGDPRAVLARWITSPENPYFARHMANRVWTWLLGRGIIHEPDDFRSTNPASNPELLDYLAEEFVRSGYDLKGLFRLILNSRTYQLSSVPNQWNKHDLIYYSHYYLKRLTAEQLATAICQATEVPDVYPGLPRGTRATQLPDVSFRSEFLDLFGRPKRATPIESERSCDIHIGQTLHMISSEYIAAKLRDGRGRAARLAASDLPPEKVVEELYLCTLSRFPTQEELAVVLAQPIDKKNRRQVFEDLLWVLMNTKEFLFNH